MSQAEPEQGLPGIFVSRRSVVFVKIRVRAYLNAAERHLCSGVAVAESVSSDEWVDIAAQGLRPGAQRCQKKRNYKGSPLDVHLIPDLLSINIGAPVRPFL